MSATATTSSARPTKKARTDAVKRIVMAPERFDFTKMVKYGDMKASGNGSKSFPVSFVSNVKDAPAQKPFVRLNNVKIFIIESPKYKTLSIMCGITSGSHIKFLDAGTQSLRRLAIERRLDIVPTEQGQEDITEKEAAKMIKVEPMLAPGKPNEKEPGKTWDPTLFVKVPKTGLKITKGTSGTPCEIDELIGKRMMGDLIIEQQDPSYKTKLRGSWTAVMLRAHPEVTYNDMDFGGEGVWDAADPEAYTSTTDNGSSSNSTTTATSAPTATTPTSEVKATPQAPAAAPAAAPVAAAASTAQTAAPSKPVAPAPATNKAHNPRKRGAAGDPE